MSGLAEAHKDKGSAGIQQVDILSPGFPRFQMPMPPKRQGPGGANSRALLATEV